MLLARFTDARLPSQMDDSLFRLRLSSAYTPIAGEDGRYVFRSELNQVEFDDPSIVTVLRSLLPLLDGTRTAEQILERAGDKKSFSRAVLQLLDQQRLLEMVDADADPVAHSAISSYFRGTSTSPDKVMRNLTAARIWIIGTGEVFSALSNSLIVDKIGSGYLTRVDENTESINDAKGASVWKQLPMPQHSDEFVETLGATDLIVSVFDRVAHPIFEYINAGVLQTRTRWLFTLLQGNNAFVGPTIEPLRTACYTCMDLRLRGNLTDPSSYARFVKMQVRDTLPPAAITLPAFARLVANHVAIEITRLISQSLAPQTIVEDIGTQIELRLPDWRVRAHKVLRLPRCPSCGQKSSRIQLSDLHDLHQRQADDSSGV